MQGFMHEDVPMFPFGDKVDASRAIPRNEDWLVAEIRQVKASPPASYAEPHKTSEILGTSLLILQISLDLPNAKDYGGTSH
jgi:hypothetical protein